MIKHILTLIVVLIASTSLSVAQFDIQDESDSHPTIDPKLDKTLNQTFKTREKFEFEFRLYTNPSLVYGGTVFVMRLNKKVWEAHLFTKNNENQWVTEEINNNGLDILWDKLCSNRVLSLPDQRTLRPQMRRFVTDTTNVFSNQNPWVTEILDGASYKFELTAGYRKRAYSYHCPYSYSKNNPNIEELYRAYAIIILVYKHLNLPLEIC